MSERYRVVPRPYDLMFPSWGARCICGAWLTKYDHSADEAREGAEEVLAAGPNYQFAHKCPKNVWSIPAQDSLPL